MTSEPKPTAKALAEKAAKEAAAAKAKAERTQREYLESKAAFDIEAEGRRQKFMQDWFAEYDAGAEEAAQFAALAAFEKALAADPVALAWLEVQRMYMRRHADYQTAVNFAASTGVAAPKNGPGASPPEFSWSLQQALQNLAKRLEGERTADIFDALERAADGEGE